MFGPRKDPSMHAQLSVASLSKSLRRASGLAVAFACAALACTQPNRNVEDEGGDGGSDEPGAGGRK